MFYTTLNAARESRNRKPKKHPLQNTKMNLMEITADKFY